MREHRGRIRRSVNERPEQVRIAQRKFRRKQKELGIRSIQIVIKDRLLHRVHQALDEARENGEVMSRSEMIVQLIQSGLIQAGVSSVVRGRK